MIAKALDLHLERWVFSVSSNQLADRRAAEGFNKDQGYLPDSLAQLCVKHGDRWFNVSYQQTQVGK